MSPGRCRAGLAVALIAAALPAGARVVEATAGGFEARHEVEVGADPAAAWRALLLVGTWWNPEHTYSGRARNLRLDARPGGCFCERLPDGGGVEHMRVVHVAPGSVLRMHGALGPLQAAGLAGSLTFTLTARPGGGTRIALGYIVGGHLSGGLQGIAPAVDAVLGEQRLRGRLGAAAAATGEP